MCSNEIIFAILHFSGSNEIHGKEKKYDQRMLDQTKTTLQSELLPDFLHFGNFRCGKAEGTHQVFQRQAHEISG